MATGGSITEITYNHPQLGTGVLYPKASEDSTYDPGGFRSDDSDDGIDGSGAAINVLTNRRWSFENVVSWDMNGNQELEKVVAMAGHPVDADWTFTHINGTVYGGKGRPVGDLQGAGMGATFSLKIAGGGLLKQI